MIKTTVSDHNVIETDMKIKWNKSTLKQKTEMYNLKNTQCQETFKRLTCKTSMRKIFDSNKDINILTKKFLKRLNGCISECFSKNRSTKKGNNKITKLYEQLHIMKGKSDNKKVTQIEEEIAKETIETIMQEIKGLDPHEGGFSAGHMWKLKNKIIPNPINVPTAMKNPEGKLCTAKKDIDKMSMDYFKNVLRNRNIKEGLEDHKEEKEELFKLRLEYTKTVKTPPWTRVEVERAMKGLKSKKSRDPTNLANKLFDPKVAGDDLVEAVQNLMNRIKSDLVYPECLKLVNISSIYKKKGPINEFSSYRGIFRVQALRNILELLLYYAEYPKIDSKLTDCNVGCRKKQKY